MNVKQKTNIRDWGGVGWAFASGFFASQQNDPKALWTSNHSSWGVLQKSSSLFYRGELSRTVRSCLRFVVAENSPDFQFSALS